MKARKFAVCVIMAMAAASICAAQETPTPEPGKVQAVTPTARLAASKTVYLSNGGGSSIPFEVISVSINEWGRFAVVDKSEKADLIVEVTSPDDGSKKKDEGGGSGGFSASAQGKKIGGRPDDSSAPTSDRIDVLMAVKDAKTKATLWSGTEKPSGVEKGMSKQEKFAAAGTRLMARFKARMEPPSTTPQ